MSQSNRSRADVRKGREHSRARHAGASSSSAKSTLNIDAVVRGRSGSSESSGPYPDSPSAHDDSDHDGSRNRFSSSGSNHGPTGPLAGVAVCALLCTVHALDPFGLAADAEDARHALHSALRLSGIFVNAVPTVTRAVEMLRKDVNPMVYDVVFAVVANMRLLDGALNLLFQSRALFDASTADDITVSTGSGVKRGRRMFAVLVAADGCVAMNSFSDLEIYFLAPFHVHAVSNCILIRFIFDSAASRLRAAGADFVERLPPSAAALQRISDSVYAAAGVNPSRASSFVHRTPVSSALVGRDVSTARPRLTVQGAVSAPQPPSPHAVSPLNISPLVAATRIHDAFRAEITPRSPPSVALLAGPLAVASQNDAFPRPSQKPILQANADGAFPPSGGLSSVRKGEIIGDRADKQPVIRVTMGDSSSTATGTRADSKERSSSKDRPPSSSHGRTGSSMHATNDAGISGAPPASSAFPLPALASLSVAGVLQVISADPGFSHSHTHIPPPPPPRPPQNLTFRRTRYL
jgi:hypothetical protein